MMRAVVRGAAGMAALLAVVGCNRADYWEKRNAAFWEATEQTCGPLGKGSADYIRCVQTERQIENDKRDSEGRAAGAVGGVLDPLGTPRRR